MSPAFSSRRAHAQSLSSLCLPPLSLSIPTVVPTPGPVHHFPHANANPGSTPLSPTATLSEILPRLYVSDLSAAEDPATLAAYGITHILSAMPLARTPVAHRTRIHMCVPLQDTPFAELVAHLPRTTSFIANALRDPRARVLVHCAMGASRSVSVVCAYLVARHGYSPSEAVAHVRSRRSCAAPNWGFVMQLDEYARSLDIDAEGSDDDMCS